MLLPDFLESDESGFISLAGHRIGLHHLVRLYAEGSSAEMIAAHYPTLPLGLIYKVIAFYLDHQIEIDAHASAHDQEISRQILSGPSAPSIVELRHRLQIGAAASNSG